jgi:hypothetical protein
MSEGQYECPTCDYTSDSERGVKIHHYQAHGESIAKITVECVVCGTEEERYECNVRNPDLCWCSTECEAEYKRNQPKELHPRWKGGEVTVECYICGTEKTVRRYRIMRSEKFFCSPECHSKWKSEAYLGENNPFGYKQIEVECEWCGEPTYKTPGRIERSNNDFCSPECTSAWQAKYQVGPNHHQWTGGRREYGPGWNPEKRRQVRKRDGFECQDCGLSQDRSLELYGRRLDVHHLVNPDKSINPVVYNAKRNLVTLCVSCHHKREGRRFTQVKFAV